MYSARLGQRSLLGRAALFVLACQRFNIIVNKLLELFSRLGELDELMISTKRKLEQLCGTIFWDTCLVSGSPLDVDE